MLAPDSGKSNGLFEQLRGNRKATPGMVSQGRRELVHGGLRAVPVRVLPTNRLHTGEPVDAWQGRREPFHGGLRAASLLRDTLRSHHRFRYRFFGGWGPIPLLTMFLDLARECRLLKNDSVIPEGAQRLSGISRRMGCTPAKPVMAAQGRREPFHGGLRAASLLRDTLQSHHRFRYRLFGGWGPIPLLAMFLDLALECRLPKNDSVIPEGAQRLSGISRRMGCKKANPLMALQGRREPLHGGLCAASLLRDTLQSHHRIRCRSFGSWGLILLLPMFLDLVLESRLPNKTVSFRKTRIGCLRYLTRFINRIYLNSL